jgi:D-alanyl-D-alanine carboxypeptidase
MQARATLASLLAFGMLASGPAAAGPALLFDASNGQVLYAEDMDDQWHPASLTKIMTAYLTFEAIKAGKLTLETKVSYSEAAYIQPPSKVGLPVGAEMAVDLALRALIIKSANDVAVLLAEAVSGTEAAFVEQMNATARRLGMTRTTFANANGLPAPEQVTTARDLARLSRAVVRDFPEHAHYWAMADMRIGKRRLGSHNGLLKTYEGADGLKTGFICDSGYNVVASATRDGRRLMAVVLGESSGRDRGLRAESLLEHGFLNQGWKTLFSTGSIDTIPIAPEAKPVISVRDEVVAWDCGGRKAVRRAIAKKRPRTKASQQAAVPSAAQEQGGGQAQNAAASQKAPEAAGGGQSAGGAAQPAQPKPRPKAAAAQAPQQPAAPVKAQQ